MGSAKAAIDAGNPLIEFMLERLSVLQICAGADFDARYDWPIKWRGSDYIITISRCDHPIHRERCHIPEESQ